MVGVNYGDSAAQCFVRLPCPDLGGRAFLLRDLYERDGTDRSSRGLYLDVPAWQYHAFEMTAATGQTS